jgi:ribosomal protein S18 acetylase RimI-like enzyme
MIIRGPLAAKATVRPVTGGTPASLVVRPARSNDVSKLSVFFSEAWKEVGPGALGFAGANDEAIGEIASEDFLKRRLATPTIQMMVAEEERRIIGFSSMRKVEAREAELSAIAVLESATGRGVGSRLLRKALDAARKRGFNSVRVKTEVTNEKAINFYRKAGFTESGKSVERVGGARVALRFMVKRLR